MWVVVALTLTEAPVAGADAGPWDWSWRGLMDVRAQGSEDNVTQLVPEPERIGLDTGFLSLTTVAELEAWKGPVTVVGSGRLYARTDPADGRRAARLHVDELHAEYAPTPEHFLFAGRRHIVHGRSLGVNPLDVAVDPLELDRSKDSNRRRAEIEGQDMLGFESFLGDRLTVTGYWVPGERALIAGTFTMPEWQSDLTAMVLDDDRPGVGLSFSRTLGDAVLAYADVALRRGRDRAVIRPDRRPGAAPGTFVADDGHGSRLYAQSSVGASYTLASGATFNIEHYFDANGYSTGEWNEIARLIAGNDAARREGRLGELPTGNLLLLGAELGRSTLRRHYGFLRAHIPDLTGRDLTAEANVLHGLADHSGSLGLRLEYGMTPHLLLGVEGRRRYGGRLDEFGLRTGRLSGSVYLTVNF